MKENDNGRQDYEDNTDLDAELMKSESHLSKGDQAAGSLSLRREGPFQTLVKLPHSHEISDKEKYKLFDHLDINQKEAQDVDRPKSISLKQVFINIICFVIFFGICAVLFPWGRFAASISGPKEVLVSVEVPADINQLIGKAEYPKALQLMEEQFFSDLKSLPDLSSERWIVFLDLLKRTQSPKLSEWAFRLLELDPESMHAKIIYSDALLSSVYPKRREKPGFFSKEIDKKEYENSVKNDLQILSDIKGFLVPIENQLNTIPESKRTAEIKGRRSQVSLFLANTYYLSWVHDKELPDEVTEELVKAFRYLEKSEAVSGETLDILETKIAMSDNFIRLIDWSWFKRRELFGGAYKEGEMVEQRTEWIQKSNEFWTKGSKGGGS